MIVGSNMGKESKLGQMAPFMKDTGIMVRFMVLESMYIPIKIFMMVNSLQVKPTEEVHSNKKMGEPIPGSGSMTSLTVKENNN